MKRLTLQNAFRLYQADCKARNLSSRTIELNDCGFKALQGVLLSQDTTVDSITPDVLRQFLTVMSESKSPSTSARYYDVLSPFLTWCVHEGFLSDNPATNIQKPKKKEPPINPLGVDDVDRMIRACGNGFTGLRNQLIIALLYDTGMRATELTSVTVNDVNPDQQTILVRYGKGNKTRVVPYGNATAKLLEKYLVLRGDLQTDRLIVNCYGESTDRYRIRTIVVGIARKANIKATTHLLRHSCAVAMIRNGCDVFSIQKMLGHSTLAMTKRYSQLADTDVQDKHRMFSPGDRVISLNRHGRKRLR